MTKILVSKCLLGKICRYDGEQKEYPQIEDLSKKDELVEACPEMLGGLPCPRARHEITGGTGADVLSGKARVISEHGADATENFLRGANLTLESCLSENIGVALMKSNSPSCGTKEIFDGTFSGRKISGRGVTAELLFQNGIKLFDENEIQQLLLRPIDKKKK